MKSRYIFFPTAKQCAESAAPVFRKKQLRWADWSGGKDYVPTKKQILQELNSLAADMREGRISASTGGLIHHSKLGYGYLRNL